MLNKKSHTHIRSIYNFDQLLVDAHGEHWLPGSTFTSSWLISNLAIWACSVDHCIAIWGFWPELSIYLIFTAECLTSFERKIREMMRLTKNQNMEWNRAHLMKCNWTVEYITIVYRRLLGYQPLQIFSVSCCFQKWHLQTGLWGFSCSSQEQWNHRPVDLHQLLRQMITGISVGNYKFH